MSPERARAIREGHGLTIPRLAAIMGVTPRTVMRWEGGSQSVDIPGPAVVLYGLLERDELPAGLYAPAGTPVEEEDQPSAC